MKKFAKLQLLFLWLSIIVSVFALATPVNFIVR